MNTKLLTKFFATLILSFCAMMANAATLTANGSLTSTTGLLGLLTPTGSPFSSTFDFSTYLESGVINLSSMCFSTEAVNQPPTSVDCASTSTTVPLLPRGATSYSGAANPPGTHFEQAGTTFNGTSGKLVILAYSPTFGVNITITVQLNANGTGSLTADAGFLGSATGTLTWN